MTKITATIAIHPGEYLRDELKARAITQSAFATHIGLTPSYLNEIIRGRRGISALIAVKIGKALGVDPQTWLNLQMRYELDLIDPKQIEIKEIAA